jgi:glyoxylase-like metal-dependent hydrolase (beta-lactamase superfamily II)
LPKEKVLCTGDFVYSSLSYMGDGYIDEWDDTLEKLKSIDFDVILPGHGGPMRTKEKIDHFQAYLRDLWSKAADMKRKGMSSEDVAKKIDLTVHKKNYPEITGPGADILAIERIYQLIESRDKTRN